MNNYFAAIPDETVQNLHFVLNEKMVIVQASPEMRALDVLRNVLGMTGTKEGCGVGECGCCTIVLNGEAVNSCMLAAFQLENKEVRTVEGLSETIIGSILQKCFVEGDAIQCGFCTPGMLMSAYALLMHNDNPTREEIRTAISGNLCRCTGYIPIINAIERAGWEIRADTKE
ncbi:MAG: (2Fe-2S)-binding protein [Clostridia bacterium]